MASSDLATLSLARANLPSFPGATLPEQLVAGHDAALAALRKYDPNLKFDPVSAAATLRQVQVWADRNTSTLASVFADPSAEALPDQLHLSFGADMARSFVVAVFTQASLGLGPWLSGAVDREAAEGSVIQSQWARTDAASRLQVFAGIVKMDRDGHLAQFFAAVPVSGLGVAPIITWAVVVAVVALAVVIVVYLYNAKRLELNNKTMADLCTRAQEKGDMATVQQCVRAAEGLQKEDPFGAAGTFLNQLGTAAMVTGVLYVLVRYGLPVLVDRTPRRAGAFA